jgi:hypothetical protein
MSQTRERVLLDLGGWISGPCASIGHLEVIPCESGAVDLRYSRYPDEVVHTTADEFAVFLVQAKAGAFDYLLPKS